MVDTLVVGVMVIVLFSAVVGIVDVDVGLVTVVSPSVETDIVFPVVVVEVEVVSPVVNLVTDSVAPVVAADVDGFSEDVDIAVVVIVSVVGEVLGCPSVVIFRDSVVTPV